MPMYRTYFTLNFLTRWVLNVPLSTTDIFRDNRCGDTLHQFRLRMIDGHTAQGKLPNKVIKSGTMWKNLDL